MNEPIAFFAVKSIGLSEVNGRKPCDLLTAARHNLREIQAEMGSVGRIDPKRIVNNIVLHGPASATEVQAQADALLAGAGIDTRELRRDHCQAIEAVFSLPTDATVNDPAAYFARCLKWVAGSMQLPVLSAVVHLDEAAPHLHLLLLPVKGRAHVGSSLIERMKLKRLRDEFFSKVAGPSGLRRQDAKVRGKVKEWAKEAVLSRCEAMGLTVAAGPMWAVFEAAIRRDPTDSMLALGIDVNSIRPCAAQTQPNPIGIGSNPIGIEANPIGFEKQAQNIKPYLCVGFAPPAPSPKPQKPIDSLSELWALVGCRLAAPRADRMRRARAAQQAAVKRHTRRAPASPAAMDANERRVVRDEHAHDTGAWN